ncbi:putative Zn-binding protein involved in type VI secretion [Pseudomonas sp. SORGH_AS199]|uniref:PAAR domain-containing protein n=1 Tax=Pseudomonas sp. SORGH_AS_0199 TaxID=3041761 RepID=UPI002865D9FF|nr:PAAR domain-containing protein [Pseudomonas sp. SORGH_AS_0199]MDR6228657.1 putative Zn-binding protein involved in type VI secretion [Pseudomonas sp. SORGH_AS_0199]
MSGKPAARLGDAVACPKCGTTALVQGSTDVAFDGLPAATLGHACGCGAVLSAAVIPTVLINGRPAAVLGSLTSHGGVMIGGSGSVIIGLDAGGAAKGACASHAGTTGLAPGQGKPSALRSRERQGIGEPANQPESAPVARDEVAEQAERPLEQRITLRIGVFFDGTGNNLFNAATGAACRAETQGFDADQAESIARHCQAFMRDPDSSYANADMNIVRLYRLYQDDTQRAVEQDEKSAAIPVYIEGIGTRAGQPDSALSMGTGLGASGVLSCVQTFPVAFSERYDQFKRINPDVVVEAIKFDVFGFSRGAAAARHFANEVLKAGGGIAATGLAKCFSWQSAKVRLNFIGLFDTVTAVVDPRRGDFTPTDITNPGVNLYLPSGCADKVVHLVARDEHRRNFALTSVAPQHQEIALPGAHADLGGGYASEMTERLLLTRPHASRERYGTDSQAAWSYRQAQRELAQLQREPWYDPGSTTLAIDTWRNNLPRPRGELPETEVIAAIRLERQVRGELSLVYLRVMHRLAVAHGAVLSPIPRSTDLAIPDDLQGVAAKLQANAQGVPLHIDQAEARLLFSRYVHLSAHWNALLGKDLSNLGIFFVNAPTATGRRNVYPNRPQPGYPE